MIKANQLLIQTTTGLARAKRNGRFMPKNRNLIANAETGILLPQNRNGLIVKRRSKTAKGAAKGNSGTKPWQENRPSKVARAKKLLRDPSYPTPEIMQSVADLLARKLERSGH